MSLVDRYAAATARSCLAGAVPVRCWAKERSRNRKGIRRLHLFFGSARPPAETHRPHARKEAPHLAAQSTLARTGYLNGEALATETTCPSPAREHRQDPGSGHGSAGDDHRKPQRRGPRPPVSHGHSMPAKANRRIATFQPEFLRICGTGCEPSATPRFGFWTWWMRSWPILFSALAGCRSCRIAQEHRLVYRVEGHTVDFLQGRDHDQELRARRMSASTTSRPVSKEGITGNSRPVQTSCFSTLPRDSCASQSDGNRVCVTAGRKRSQFCRKAGAELSQPVAGRQ